MAKSVATLHNATALAAAKPWPKQTEIDAIARKLDHLARYDERLNKAIESPFRNQPLEGLQSLLDEFSCSGGEEWLVDFKCHPERSRAR